ncbi:MAG: hypothetical protein R3B49_07450 [Phycisphaerales bacterium]
MIRPISPRALAEERSACARSDTTGNLWFLTGTPPSRRPARARRLVRVRLAAIDPIDLAVVAGECPSAA